MMPGGVQECITNATQQLSVLIVLFLYSQVLTTKLLSKFEFKLASDFEASPHMALALEMKQPLLVNVCKRQ